MWMNSSTVGAWSDDYQALTGMCVIEFDQFT